MARPSKRWEERLASLLPEVTNLALRLVKGNDNKAGARVRRIDLNLGRSFGRVW
jgi:hypothetical protein